MVDKLHSYIREDLIANQADLLNMQHYWTHKYRSRDRLLDINIGMYPEPDGTWTVQLYVADKHTRIRERFTLLNSRLIDTNTVIKRYA